MKTSRLFSFCGKVAAVTAAVIVMIAAMSVTVFAETHTVNSLSDTAAKTAGYLMEQYSDAELGSEWAIIGMARAEVPGCDDFFAKYLDNLTAVLNETGGVLGEEVVDGETVYTYTDYARVVLALTALGLDPTDFAGYNLVAPLTSLDKITAQGTNAAIFALIALDCGDYDADIRAEYLDYLKDNELEDGGFEFSPGWDLDIDTTAMAVTALLPYADADGVQEVIDRAIAVLNTSRFDTGLFGGMWGESSDTTGQIIMTLCDLGINPMTANVEWFGDGIDPVTALMEISFDAESGGFSMSYVDWTTGELVVSVNAMTSGQVLRALAACIRFSEGKTGVYDMTDVAGSNVTTTTTTAATSTTVTAAVTSSTTDAAAVATTTTAANADTGVDGSVGVMLMLCGAALVCLAVCVQRVKSRV